MSPSEYNRRKWGANPHHYLPSLEQPQPKPITLDDIKREDELADARDVLAEQAERD